MDRPGVAEARVKPIGFGSGLDYFFPCTPLNSNSCRRIKFFRSRLNSLLIDITFGRWRNYDPPLKSLYVSNYGVRQSTNGGDC